MNPSFFGLEGHPFEREGDAGEAFLSEGHEALCAELHAGLKAPHGITLLIGEEGSGKTTLARSFAEQLADSATVAYLPTVGPGLRHLLTEIIEQLGGTESGAGEEQVLLNELARLARARAEHGRTTLIILDDAHELPAKTIERLGKLFGDDPADPSLLHIILVGRGELLDRMNAANDRSILKHLVQVCRMDPIGPEESFRYIADRIAKVGGVVDSIFTPDALHMIVQRANGFPARIDALCSASLECAEDRGEASVDTDAVDVACAGPTNTERFEFDDVAPGEDEESATPSYFLVDDGEESGADGSDTIERQSG
ncbi:MAG TPA: ATP-binding protein, partial [Gammaproteobacteria bacterium]